MAAGLMAPTLGWAQRWDVRREVSLGAREIRHERREAVSGIASADSPWEVRGFVVDAPDVATTLCAGLDETFARGTYRVALKKASGSGDTRLEWIGPDDGKEHRLTGEPHSSAWRRFKAWFYGILPIEKQL